MDEVIKAREELWTSVEGLPNEMLRRVNNDGWSILHVLEHLYLFEKVVIGVIEDSLSKPPVSEQFQDNPLGGIRDRTTKRTAPDTMTPMGRFQDLDDARRDLSQSRERLISVVSSADPDTLRVHGAQHRRLGMLSAAQWVQLVGEHDRRHIAQIEEMKSV